MAVGVFVLCVDRARKCFHNFRGECLDSFCVGGDLFHECADVTCKHTYLVMRTDLFQMLLCGICVLAFNIFPYCKLNI